MYYVLTHLHVKFEKNALPTQYFVYAYLVLTPLLGKAMSSRTLVVRLVTINKQKITIIAIYLIYQSSNNFCED